MKFKDIKRLIQFLMISVLSAPFSQATADMEWEFGLGIGHLTTNAYLGASENVSLTTPVPFIKVKTDWFDLSEGNLKMKWFEDTPFQLSFGFDVALPVDSADIDVREGMDDLDSILQVGPMLSYELSVDHPVKWKLEFPLLYAVQLGNSNFEDQGWSFAPRVAMRYQIKSKQAPLDLEMSLGPVYGSDKLYQYYYSVDSSDATASRPQYDAEGGYAGYRLGVSFTKRVDDLWFGLFMRYHDIADATFSDSPLVDDKSYWLVTFAMSWVFASSN